jgi:sporulation protein YabP
MTGNEKGVNEHKKLILTDRERLEMSGVLDVTSFDEEHALIKTESGMLAVDGEGLHVTSLDLGHGSISFEGKINGLFFSDAQKGKRKMR